MIITIDGPAGAGKSSAAKGLAKRLGFRFLDTGAMFRAVTYAALQRNVALSDPSGLAELAEKLQISITDDLVLLDGEDVTDSIRSLEVTNNTHFAADNLGVRKILAGWQRSIAEGKNLVTEGRDQGSAVFPDAECKIFLTASESERASRRVQDLNSRGIAANPTNILEEQRQRDYRDRNRPVGALLQAPDAIEVLTDGLNAEEVIDRLYEIARKALP